MKKFNVVYQRYDADGKLVEVADIFRAESEEILELVLRHENLRIRSIHPFPMPCVREPLERIKRGLTPATAT